MSIIILMMGRITGIIMTIADFGGGCGKAAVCKMDGDSLETF